MGDVKSILKDLFRDAIQDGKVSSNCISSIAPVIHFNTVITENEGSKMTKEELIEKWAKEMIDQECSLVKFLDL